MTLKLCRDGVLHTTLTITHQARSITLDNMIVDTGTAESLVSVDIADQLFESYEETDEIRWHTGIGGRHISVRRRVDQIHFQSVTLHNFPIDFADLSHHPGIHGLIGLDILLAGSFVFDFRRLDIYTLPHRHKFS